MFVADALIEAGVDPSDIVKGLGLGPMPLPGALDKYNPDQPRVPAGNGLMSGQWTSREFIRTADRLDDERALGVQVADASDIRGHEVRTDATSRRIVDP